MSSKILISSKFAARYFMYLMLSIFLAFITFRLIYSFDSFLFEPVVVVLTVGTLYSVLFIVLAIRDAIRLFGRLPGLIVSGFIILMTWELMNNPLNVDLSLHLGLFIMVILIPYISFCFITCYTYVSIKGFRKGTIV